MTPEEARQQVIEVATTHRHGPEQEACTYCANFYGNMWDKLVKTLPWLRKAVEEA